MRYKVFKFRVLLDILIFFLIERFIEICKFNSIKIYVKKINK